MASNIEDHFNELSLETKKDFIYWEERLNDRLRSLLKKAEEEAWPFVPEEWQYGDHAQAVSLKDVLNSHSSVPDLLEKDILLKCLECAMKEELYEEAVAVAFLLDRYMYWSGRAEYLQQLLGEIRKRCHTVRIAPQLWIRKARLLKDQSAIQEADDTLQYLIQNIENLWTFRSQSQLEVTLATCIQIRGEIHHNLGLPVEAASFIIESIARYRAMLPEPDKKGISSSLGLLAEIFRGISYRDFEKLCTSCHFFNAGNPLLEAAAACYEAAFFGRFESLFTCRHHRRGGEALLTYLADLAEEDPSREKLYGDAVYALSLSLYSFGRDVNSLRSREQAFEFIRTMFQLFIAHSMNAKPRDAEFAMEISSLLFQEYCSSNEIILGASELRDLNQNLRRLSLGEFSSTGNTEQRRPPVTRFEYIYPRLSNGLQPRVPTTGRSLAMERTPTEHGRQEPYSSSDSISTPSSGSSGSVVDPLAETPYRTEYGYNSRENSSVPEHVGHEVLVAGEADLPIRGSRPSSQVNSDSQTPACNGNLAGGEAHGTVSDVEQNEQLANGENDNAVSESNAEDNDRPEDDEVVNGVAVDEAHGDGEAVLESSPDAARSFSYRSSLSQPQGSLGQIDESLVRPYLKLIRAACRRQDANPEQSAESGIQPFKTYRARVFKYDVVGDSWSFQDTLVYVQDALKMPEGKEGNHRDVIKINFLAQEERRAQYLGKRYRIQKPIDAYFEDVRIQMIARHYVAVFNDRLKRLGWNTDFIQIVPALHLQIVSRDGHEILDYINVEPFVQGSFIKLTNNTGYVNKHVKKSRTDAATSFTHFTYHESGGRLMVVDLQGWVPPNRESTIILTDPAINSVGGKCFSSVDMGMRGFREFWSGQHPECNEICHVLGMQRPTT